MAAIAELERNIIVERIRGGIRRAREQGKQLGRRPLTDPNLLRTVLRMKAQGKSIRAIAEAVKVTKSFVHKTCKNCGSQTLESPAFKN
ncbi:MAG: recombinase family protein [Nitrospira sp.]|nr:recombinase family protein [Nitrospira sp.]